MRWRARTRRLLREVSTLAVAARDPRTPLAAKVVMVVVVAYAVSPVDLVPDPIPVLGLLDDALLLPLGIALAIRLVPDDVLVDARRAAELSDTARWGRRAAIGVIVGWMLVAALGAAWAVSHLT